MYLRINLQAKQYHCQLQNQYRNINTTQNNAYTKKH